MSSQHRKPNVWLIFFLYQSLELWHLHPLVPRTNSVTCPARWVPLPPGLSRVGLFWSSTAFRVLLAVSSRELDWKYARQEGHWSCHPSIKKSEDGTVCSTPPTEDRVLSTPSGQTHWIPLGAHAGWSCPGFACGHHGTWQRGGSFALTSSLYFWRHLSQKPHSGVSVTY